MRFETAFHIPVDLGGDILTPPPPSPSFFHVQTQIHKQYTEECRKNGLRALSLSSFKDVWLKCTPHSV